MCFKSKRSLRKEVKRLNRLLEEKTLEYDFVVSENNHFYSEVNRQGDKVVELTKENAELKNRLAKFDHRNRGRDSAGQFTK